MQLRNILAGVSLIAMTATPALAKGKKEPNCDVNGKKVHVKDEAACTKKKGTWAAAPAADAGAKPADAPAAAMAPAAPAAGGAPAEAAPAK